jgi:hypothetical protein
MSEFKGTKGKWYVLNHIDDKKWHNISSDKGIIVRCFYRDLKPIVTEKESKANAKLISCAPEMLEMLQSVLLLQKQNYGSGMKTHLAFIGKAKEIEQLIKKATEI